MSDKHDRIEKELMHSYKCISCKKDIGSCYTSKTNDPMVDVFAVSGLIFEATGNYGSAVFDHDTGNTQRLIIYMCDDCLLRNAEIIKFLKTDIPRVDPLSLKTLRAHIDEDLE